MGIVPIEEEEENRSLSSFTCEDMSGRWLSASQEDLKVPETSLRRVRTDLRTSISNPASATCLSLQQHRPQKTIFTS